MVESLGARAFKGAGVSSLCYEVMPLRITDDYTKQDLVKGLFARNGAVTVQLIPTDTLDSTSYQYFLMRMRVGAWGRGELIFRCTVSGNIVDGDDDDKPGFDFDGNNLSGGCLGSVSISRDTSSGGMYTPAYSHGQPIPERRLTYVHASQIGTGYFTIGPDNTPVRLGCPPDWRSSRNSSEDSHQGASGDGIWFFVGPYRIRVRFCFGVKDKSVDEVGSDKYLRSVTYEIKGLKVDSFDKTYDVGKDGPDKVPVFPVLSDIGPGCFEGCTQLESIDGFPARVTDIPSRCFAGCPFEHDVVNPEVKRPIMTFNMPVLDDRIVWQGRLKDAFYLNCESVWDSTTGSFTGVEFYNGTDGAHRTILADITHTQDPITGDWSDTLTLNASSSLQLDPFDVWNGSSYDVFTPVLEEIHHDYVVFRITPEVTVRFGLSWSGYGKTRSPDLSGENTVLDSLADEMRVYLDGCRGSVTYDESHDFVLVNYNAVDENGDDITSPLVLFDWSRLTGEWWIRISPSVTDPNDPTFYIRGTGGSKSVRSMGAEGNVVDGSGYFIFKCMEHTDWEVHATTLAEAVQILAYSVDIPPTVSDVGDDCFSFKDYPDAKHVLQGVYFHVPATTIRRMSGFPFGVPPGCAIYANGGIIYREPLPDEG